MENLVKFIIFIFKTFMVLLVIAAGVVYWYLPNVGMVPNMDIKVTKNMYRRGKYLTNHVVMCMNCHSKKDWHFFSGPIIPLTEGMGGDRFDESHGVQGAVYATNITPYGIRYWTDGELYRLITTGVNKEGEPVHPIMPYKNYSVMKPYDVQSIIGYLRTIRSIKNDTPARTIKFPQNFILRTIPKRAKPFIAKSKHKEGEYIATIAGCISCHTPMTNGKLDTENLLAGGMEFKLPNGSFISSPNIRGKKMSQWSKKLFIDSFNRYNVPKDRIVKVDPDDKNTPMPWTSFAGMTAKDLSAIHDYLMSIK